MHRPLNPILFLVSLSLFPSLASVAAAKVSVLVDGISYECTPAGKGTKQNLRTELQFDSHIDIACLKEIATNENLSRKQEALGETITSCRMRKPQDRQACEIAYSSPGRECMSILEGQLPKSVFSLNLKVIQEACQTLGYSCGMAEAAGKGNRR